MLLMDERNGEAEQAFRSVAIRQLLPLPVRARTSYGRTGRNAAALADLNSALAQHPQHDDALFERARVEYALGGEASDTARAALLAQALRDIELAVKLDPTSPEFQDLLARYRLAIPAAASSHVVVRRGWSSGAVSSATLDGRMRDAAVKGRVPRAAFYHIAYPKDSPSGCDGWIAVLLRPRSCDGRKCPGARVREDRERRPGPLSGRDRCVARLARRRAGHRHPRPISGRCGLSPSRRRPLHGGDLLVDFAAHYRAFLLDRFDGGKLLGWLGRAPWPTSGGITIRRLELIQREYPDLAPVLAGGDQ